VRQELPLIRVSGNWPRHIQARNGELWPVPRASAYGVPSQRAASIDISLNIGPSPKKQSYALRQAAPLRSFARVLLVQAMREEAHAVDLS
jgi:hypothetical protein